LVPELHFITAAKMTQFAYILVTLAACLVIDWALFDRVTLSLSVIKGRNPTKSFRELIFPRIILTMVAALIVSKAVYSKEINITLLLIGVGLFLISVCFAIVTAFRHGRSS